MSYLDYRNHYKQCDAMDFARKFLAQDMPLQKAHAYAIGQALKSAVLTMDDLLMIQQLCRLEHASAEDLLDGFSRFGFKTTDDFGCKAEDAHALAADFVQECNAFGRGNPLFYGAYLMGSFCHVSPFATENIACAAVLCNFYLVSRGMPPILFPDLEAVAQAVQCYCEAEELQPLLNLLTRLAQETYVVLQ